MTENPIFSNEDRFMFYLKKINDELDKQMNNDLREFGITFNQVEFLRTIEYKGGKTGLTLKQIQEYLYLSQPTVSGLIKRLLKKDMLTVKVNSQDHRNKIVMLTPTGKDILSRLDHLRKATKQKITKDLSEEESEQLYVLLKRIFDSLNNK